MATSGKLHVTIVEARVEHDQNMFSSMKPYVQIEHRMERHQSKPGSGKEPKFDETFIFDVKYVGDDFHMRLMNDGNLMADAVIKVSSLCINGGIDDWWQVNKDGKKEGYIHFKAVWEPSDAQTGASQKAEMDGQIQALQMQNQQMQMQNMQMQQQQQMMGQQQMYGMQPMQPMMQPGYVQPVVVVQQHHQVTKTEKRGPFDPDMGMTILVVNILFPGLGTMIAGCVDSDNCCKWTCLGFLQMLLAPLIVGWIWAICTGIEINNKAKR